MKSIKHIPVPSFKQGLTIVFLILAVSCMRDVDMTVLKPAAVNMPQEIDTLAVVNRTKIEGDGEEVLDVVEGAVTGEGLFADRKASRKSIQGATERLQQSPRFEVVRPNKELSGKNVNQFPPPLEWSEVEEICNESGAEALVVLEIIDSDVSISVDKEKLVNTSASKRPKVEATMGLTLKTGWRVYDPEQKTIRDELSFRSESEDEAEGTTASGARSKLADPSDELLKLAYRAGQQYANRISPNWQHVDREYYKSGNDIMDRADIEGQKSNWDKAGQLWKKAYRNARKRKILKRSAYNVALYMEIKGKLDSAVIWAERSAYDHGNNRAEDYVKLLRYRKRQQERVDQQLKQ